MKRRLFLASVSALALARPALAAAPRYLESEPFHADTVRKMAQALSLTEFKQRAEVPAAWSELTYDEYRKIWFDVRNAVWSGDPLRFEMDLFHPGLYFPRPVEIDVVEGEEAKRLAFDLDLFDRADDAPDLPVDENMGYSGLRYRYLFAGDYNFREFAVFQGASYFRAIGAAQHYGLSARGLALRTGDPNGEEFPEFVRFWVETPARGDETVVMHALLNSPSVTGAYRLEIAPGAACDMRVECTLFPRVDLDHVGVAPLTSMFLYDQTNRGRFDDFRPAVHDSDGLLMWNANDEMLWRPLANPVGLQLSSFVDENPRGFGLMQRARALHDFADLEAHYQDRPSLWIEPDGDWGTGMVRLVEIPSEREIYDNIVAYWRPRDLLVAGEEYRFAYRMRWSDETGEAPPPRNDVARVLETYIGRNFEDDAWLVAIDFADHPALEGNLGAEEVQDRMLLKATSDGAEITPATLQRNPETGGGRMALTFDPGDNEAAELRAQIFRDGVAITEVWIYRWTRA